MNNSAMFGSLDDFLQESAFADLSDGVLLLPDERYRLEVTASIAATCPAQELIDQIMTADAAEQPQLLEQLLEMAAVKKGRCYSVRRRPLGHAVHAGLCR